MVGSVPTIMFSPFEKVTQPVPAPPPPCDFVARGKAVEKTNLIGQMQDSSARGSKVTWNYKTQADSTFGIGVSDSPTKHFSESGSFTITNSMGGNGGFPAGPGFNRFVYGHFFRQRYVIAGLNPICDPLQPATPVTSTSATWTTQSFLILSAGMPSLRLLRNCGLTTARAGKCVSSV